MDSTIVAILVVIIAVGIAAIIALSKSGSGSEEGSVSETKESKSSDDIVLSAIDPKHEKNRKQDNRRDIPVFNRLQNCIDLNWISRFEDNQLAYPHYVKVAVTDDLHTYWNEAQKPENVFSNPNLAEAHLILIKSIKAFQNTVIRHTTFVRPGSNTSVVNSKAEGYRKSSVEYDERYNKEVKSISNRAKGIIIAYKRFVQVAKNESVCDTFQPCDPLA